MPPCLTPHLTWKGELRTPFQRTHEKSLLYQLHNIPIKQHGAPLLINFWNAGFFHKHVTILCFTFLWGRKDTSGRPIWALQVPSHSDEWFSFYHWQIYDVARRHRIRCRRVVGGISLYCVLLADPLGMLPEVFITVTQVHLKKRPDYTNRSDDRSSSLLSAELTSPLQSAVYTAV